LICPSPAPQIAQWLDSIGIVGEPNESLAEATARAMGLSILELRAELQQIATICGSAIDEFDNR
jgi:hypothetical protein